MHRNALFFPYIALPNEAWTVKSLLYWDKLSSIVPLEYLDRPEKMSEFMRVLLYEGLVEPVMPGQYIRQIARFDDHFIQFIERRLQRSRRGNALSSRMTRIHIEKLSHIPDFLESEGLAKRVDWQWYEVESTTANLFMAYLAACLGAIPEVDATPVTNQITVAQYLQPQFRHVGRHPARKQAARDVVLSQLLPTPAGPVDVVKLLHFKQRHGRLLQRFRAAIEAHCTRIAALPDASDRIEANEAFLQECEQSIAEIEEAMRPSLGKVVLGAIAPIFGAGLSVQALNHGEVVGHVGFGLTLANAIYTAITTIRGPEAIRHRPLAYVAEARRTLGMG